MEGGASSQTVGRRPKISVMLLNGGNVLCHMCIIKDVCSQGMRVLNISLSIQGNFIALVYHVIGKYVIITFNIKIDCSQSYRI